MNTAQTNALKKIKNEIKNGNFRTFGNDKKYVLVTGISGATLAALVNKGKIEKLNHKFYTQMYAVK